MSIFNTFASKLFPEGDFQNIRANAPNQMSYNIDATRDLVKNQPFNPLAPAMAATFSLPYDIIQGIGRAFKGFKPDTGILDYDVVPNAPTFADIGKSIAAENPIDSLLGRTYGATLGLGDKLTSYGKTISDAIISPAYAPELDDIESIIEARKNREELNRIGSLALDDAGLNTAAMIDDFSQTSKPRFDLRNFLTNVKDKGVNMFGSGKDLALRGIGSIIGGPVGGFIGSALGKMQLTPEQETVKGLYDLDSIGRVQSGIMQGYNPVSLFGPTGLSRAMIDRITKINKTLNNPDISKATKDVLDKRKAELQAKIKAEQAAVRQTIEQQYRNRPGEYGGRNRQIEREQAGPGYDKVSESGSF